MSIIMGWAVKWSSGPNNVDSKVTEHLLYLADWAHDKACHARHTVLQDEESRTGVA